MNNKTLKRVVAFLATALLVCSCAFAAEILNTEEAAVTYDATSGEIVVPFAPGTGATKAALLVRNERTDEIVALAQFNSLNGGEVFEETIDTEKVAAGDKLLISVGDNAATSTSAATAEYTVPVPVVEYTITFVDEDGTTVLQTGKVAEDAMPVAPADPVKEATAQYTYTFAGWTPEIVAATADATYTATYTETVNKYTITLAVDGVAVDTVEAEFGANIAAAIADKTATKEADAEFTYAFAGWDVAEDATVEGNITIEAIFTETAIPSEPEYTSTLEDVTYNSIEGTVVRIAGLDTTSVVTVDGVTAKYYTKTDGTLVHVACVPRTAEPEISVAAGTPELIVYGNVNGIGEVDINDVTDIGRRVAGYERFKPSYVKYELSTDLMELLACDVNGDKKVDVNDNTELGRAVAGYERFKPSYVKYTLETMGCYKK